MGFSVPNQVVGHIVHCYDWHCSGDWRCDGALSAGSTRTRRGVAYGRALSTLSMTSPEPGPGSLSPSHQDSFLPPRNDLQRWASLASRAKQVNQPALGRQKLILWIACSVILLVSALAFYSTRRLIAASEQVERTQNMLIETNRFLSEIRAVESSARGYFVTGDDRYLEVRTASSASAEATATRIRALETSGELRQRLDRFVRLAEDRLQYASRLVQLRGSPSEALRAIRLGTDIMDRVASDAETIIAAQTNAYRAEQVQLQSEAWLASSALAVGVILSLSTIGWLFALRGREVEMRQRLADELQALNLELDTRVSERTNQLRDSEERAGLVIDAALDAVVSIDQEGMITGWNAQARNTFGWTSEEALGRQVDET
ncbi:MAG TPA: CHASE3 domain-containing protein, partial [Sphingomicrobium sp.]|nr:CHASE3 domain-containing protein [Sphingomicrobium sp.]